MAEQRMQHEQERTRLQQQHSAEKDSLVQERQREVSSLERQARAALQQHQEHTQEWRKRDAQSSWNQWKDGCSLEVGKGNSKCQPHTHKMSNTHSSP